MFKLAPLRLRVSALTSFNPSVGILGVQAGRAPRPRRSEGTVSIPRSGFWVFKPRNTPANVLLYGSFNPSVGILGVQAEYGDLAPGTSWQFQSLGRDSGCSSPKGTPCRAWAMPVSIPRSGFWVFKPSHPAPPRRRWKCFNPSVGILGVQAGRRTITGGPQCAVSIPRSGFWVFKHLQVLVCLFADYVSIPRSGFWVFKQPDRPVRPVRGQGFNPSVGILGVQAYE